MISGKQFISKQDLLKQNLQYHLQFWTDWGKKTMAVKLETHLFN